MIAHGQHSYIPWTSIPPLSVACLHISWANWSKIFKNLYLELPAFCHLCLPDAPAATELLRLNKDELLHLSQAYKEAINQWCCCARDYAAQTRSKLDQPGFHPRSKGTTLIVFLTSLKRKMANIASPGQKTRQVLHCHESKSGGVSWSSYFSLFSRKNTAKGYTRSLESLGYVLGTWTERRTPAAHFRSMWYKNAKYKDLNQWSLEYDHPFAWQTQPVGAPWSRWKQEPPRTSWEQGFYGRLGTPKVPRNLG